MTSGRGYAAKSHCWCLCWPTLLAAVCAKCVVFNSFQVCSYVLSCACAHVGALTAVFSCQQRCTGRKVQLWGAGCSWNERRG